MKNQDWELYNDETFYPAFFSDLKQARALIIIHSPYLTARQVSRFKNSFRDCLERGVRICVIAQQPYEWNKRHEVVSPTCNTLESTIKTLQQLGIHVTLEPNVHQKLVVIDDDILWSGSMNVLSHFGTRERMERWHDRGKVQQAIIHDNLDNCKTCKTVLPLSLIPEHDSYLGYMQMMGLYIMHRRIAIRISQARLAQIAGVSRAAMGEIEQGKRTVNLETLQRIATALKHSLLPIPWHCTRTIADRCGYRSELAEIDNDRANVENRTASSDHPFTDLMLYLGQFIAHRRQQLRMSQSQLAAEAGLRQSVVSQIEKGRRSFQSDTLYRISYALRYMMLPIPWQHCHSVSQFVDFPLPRSGPNSSTNEPVKSLGTYESEKPEDLYCKH